MDQSLYIVDYPKKNDYAEAYPIPVEVDFDRMVHCPECGRWVSGGYWAQPREVVLTSRKIPDFLYAYCDHSPFLLTEHALEMIRQAGLTGIEKAEEIEQVRFQRKSKKETPIPHYFHIELVRSRITVDHEKSVIQYGTVSSDSGTCPLCRQVPKTMDFTRYLSFRMEAYEGYDIFHIYEMGNTVFLSQRFVDFCREAGLTNLHFTPARKYGRWAAEYFLDGNENAE